MTVSGAVAILTDFGGGSNYVGVMKGVLLKTFPECKIIDLFNDVKPQSVREGAWILSTSCEYFPPSVSPFLSNSFFNARCHIAHYSYQFFLSHSFPNFSFVCVRTDDFFVCG